MLFCVVSFAQTTVKGKIIDNSGLPLPGANIVIVGSSSGTISDFEGKYSLTVEQELPFSIRVSYTGVATDTLQDIALDATDAAQYITFVPNTSGGQTGRVDSELTYNPSSNVLTTENFRHWIA